MDDIKTTAAASGTITSEAPAIDGLKGDAGSVYGDLADAQAEFLPVRKNCTNPAFHSHYADLGSILSSVRAALNRHGFALSWKIETTPEHVSAAVVLYHKSGEVIEGGAVVLPYYSAKGIPAQAIGSALTYARRYAISAFLGISTDDDDDGNGAGQPEANSEPAAQTVTPEEIDRLDKIARQGVKAYGEAWKAISNAEKKELQRSGWHDELKRRASAADEANRETAEQADAAFNNEEAPV